VTHNLLKVCDINIFKVIEENEICERRWSPLRISAGSSCENRKVINGSILSWQNHARKRTFGWFIHVVTARM